MGNLGVFPKEGLCFNLPGFGKRFFQRRVIFI